jgi:hypothetical protein
MSYLDRLKRKIPLNAHGTEATKPTKPSFVPFVAPLPAPSRQISAANEAAADPLAQRTLELLRAEPGLRLAVVSDPVMLPDGRIRIGYARRTDDGLIVTAVIAAHVDPFDLPALVERFDR